MAVLLAPTIAVAQPQPRIEAEASPGRPFGVGVFSIQLPPGQRMGADSVSLSERNGRVFYPIYQTGAVARLLRGAGLGARRMTVYFLFTGDQPLDLTLATPQPLRYTVNPRPSPNAERIASGWWRGFSQPGPANNYPQFHDYIAATLARRMGMQMTAEQSNWLSGSLSGQFDLLAGAPSLRASLARQALLGDPRATQSLDFALPDPLEFEAPTEIIPPAPEGQPEIEPIAMRVPQECFYLHAGNFVNFLWLRHRLDEWGGNLRALLSEQTVDYALNQRAQQQIGLKESALGEVLGPAVISDVALIGTDTFLREGGAMGVLFEARSSTLLSNDLSRQRSDLLSENKDAKEQKLTLSGKEVSLIATPDNRIRSFYAVDGDYQLVTTSRALAERFLQTGQQDADKSAAAKPLGASAEFRAARSRLPLSRQDVVFIYLSRAFFENLMSPHYEIEMVRRLRSATAMESILLAQLLARGEGHAADSVEELIAADALPAGFGQQNDGSRVTLVDGKLVDSIRGGRGTFVPIPDMPVVHVSQSEDQQYQQFVQGAAQWGPPDPVLVGIQKTASKTAGLDHVTLDVEAAPLSAKHLEFLNRWLGPPAAQRLAPIPGDLVHLEASVRGGGQVQTGDHFLAFGLQDLLPGQLPADERPLLEALKVVIGQSPLRGYLAAWPQPGLLGPLGGTANVQTDPAGYAHLITNVWRRTFDQFTVMSFHREILEQVTPLFRLEPSQAPVQISLRIEDLQGTNLAGWVNREGYQRAAKMSDGNVALLAMLAGDFRVPRDQAVDAAQRVLDGKLLDPLGGQYQLTGTGPDARWRSTKFAPETPANYQFPALTWIRGLDAHCWFNEGRLVLHGELEMPAYGAAGRKADEVKPRGKAF